MPLEVDVIPLRILIGPVVEHEPGAWRIARQDAVDGLVVRMTESGAVTRDQIGIAVDQVEETCPGIPATAVVSELDRVEAQPALPAFRRETGKVLLDQQRVRIAKQRASFAGCSATNAMLEPLATASSSPLLAAVCT